MLRSLALTSLLALPLLAASGCGGGDSPGGGGGGANSTIAIVPNAFNKGMMAFSPDTDSVRVNDVVRMQNNDSIQHRIQPVTVGSPDWGVIPGGQFTDRSATQTGTFNYRCTIGGHIMSGTLVVLP